MVPLLLGLDLGTSSIKAVLFDPATGTIQATAAQEYPVNKPAPNRAEQNPADWWQAAVAVTRRVVANTSRPHVTAVSFSGQMHGTVLLNAQANPLHPAIIWADQRSAKAVQTLIQTVGAADYAAITGTLPAVGFLGATLLWLADQQPDLLAQVKNVVFPKDYLRLKMTGAIATDMSDAAGSGIFNIHRQIWARQI
ncbi:MAG: xylulokinase, partial [Chloroflexi bacterium]